MKKTTAKNFPEVIKDKCIDKAQHRSSMINREKSTPRHTGIMKWCDTKSEDLKNLREKSQGIYKEQTINYQKTFLKGSITIIYCAHNNPMR